MFYIGRQDLKNFILRKENPTLKSFITEYQHIITKTNCSNSWHELKRLWTKRYKALVTENRPALLAHIKKLCKVNSDLWIDAYDKVTERSAIKIKLLEWCKDAFKGEPITVDIATIESEIDAMKEDPSLVDELSIMSLNMLKIFNDLNTIEKHVLKLVVSDIVNIRNEDYLAVLSSHLKPETMRKLKDVGIDDSLDEDTKKKIKQEFDEGIKAIKDNGLAKQGRSAAGIGPQVGNVLNFLVNKIDTWKKRMKKVDPEHSADGSSTTKKRKLDLSENDILQVVKEVLETIFADTDLFWVSGEKTSLATKKSKIENGTLSRSSNKSNIVGRKSDLLLLNEDETVLCAAEMKDGCSNNSSSQESKSCRITKCIRQYNSMIAGGKTCVGMDWNGFQGYVYYCKAYEGIDLVLGFKQLLLPVTIEELELFGETLLALYEMKTFLVEYSCSLGSSFVDADDSAVYHSA
ncbi:hypothetical protein A0J61_08479 [Choanephora cucurbitarum]|uniref:Uncharacterized protein n=1 Tax=Choanephora cucurbitarum TaxID=101091 RepID=A0A1C7N301_9FUNG|nr:hypothetical protein A0J61_08479 [Choanephora cucurbitarum]